MKKLIVLALTLVFILTLPQVTSAASLKTAIIPADAQWVVHVDIERLVSTKLFELIMARKDSKDILEGKNKMVEKLGIDPLKDLTGITIFGSGKGEKNAVVSLTGNLNKTHLVSLVKQVKDHKELKHGKHTIYQWEDAGFGAFVKDNMLLMGKAEESIRNALDVIAGKKKSIKNTQLMSYLQEVPKGAVIQMVVDDISSVVGKSEPMILQKTGMAFFMAMEKDEALNLKLKMTTDTNETAANIGQIINGFVAMARMQVQSKEEIKDKALKLLDALKVSIKGNVIEMGITYPSAEILDFLNGTKKKLNLSI
jgi:hypothetical protein